jgi:hypothetical protein
MVGMDFDSNTGQYAAQGPNLYMLARLNQRPGLSVQEVLGEYFGAFGPAASAVRDYFAYWEQVRKETAQTWTQTMSHWDPEKPTVKTRWLENLPHTFYLGGHTIFTPQRFAEGARRLDRAAEAAAGDDMALQRVEFLRKGLEHARLGAVVGAEFTKSQETGDRTPYLTAMAKLDAFRRSIEMDLVSNFNQLAYLENTSWDRPTLSLFEGRQIIEALPIEWQFALDEKDIGLKQGWEMPSAGSSRWDKIRTDAAWEGQIGRPYDGIAWYRVEFNVSHADAGRELAILFGAVDEAARIFLNGQPIAERKFANPDDWKTPFTVPLTGHVRAGRNTLVVRVEDRSGAGGVWKPAWIVAAADAADNPE